MVRVCAERVEFRLAEKYDKYVYAVVSNMSIAAQRRDFLQRMTCFICNQLEAGILFLEDYDEKTPEEMCEILSEKVVNANIPSMVVTMGGQGAVYANCGGEKGICPARKVIVKDTTGAGDAFLGAILFRLKDKTLCEIADLSTDELDDILDFANASGSLTTTKTGAAPSIPTLDEIAQCRKSVGKLK